MRFNGKQKSKTKQECQKNRPLLIMVRPSGAPWQPHSFSGYLGVLDHDKQYLWQKIGNEFCLSHLFVTSLPYNFLQKAYSMLGTVWCWRYSGKYKQTWSLVLRAYNTLNIIKSSNNFAHILKSWNSSLAPWFLYVPTCWFWLVITGLIIYSFCLLT